MSITNQSNIKFKDLIAEFNHIKTNALSGNLIIQVADIPSWMLSFSSGRLAGISGGIDPIDRWRRNLALASLNMPLDRLIKSTNHQEAFLNSNKLAQECAIEEVLFDIIQFSQNNQDALLCHFKNTQLQSVLPLLDLQPILSVTIKAWQDWGKHGLSNYAPSLFLIIQKSTQSSDLDDNKDLEYLISSIDGSRSLRSLAIYHQKKLIDVAASLLPLLRSGIIGLSLFKQSEPAKYSVPEPNIVSGKKLDSQSGRLDGQVEISLPNHPANDIDRQSTIPSSPLIACIDDSISVYKSLEKIIAEHGYRSFGVQDPLKIITSLIRNKPDLIFLDLVMPVTNGYEVCEQIRKTPSLTNIPIIILTGNDGLIDRVRTKFVGANGFIGKPIKAESIVTIIDKYLVRNQPEKITQNIRLDPPQHTYKRVLVIDDDLNIREVVSMCLHKLKSWDVLAVGSAQEGLDEIQINSPDVIILDVMMPGMDGIAFLRKLRSNPSTKLIPVLLLTANRYLPDKDLLSELGVVETISKPFLPIDLVRQIDRALVRG
jgi:two-component system, chemotaxis family, response regulator PixG